MASAWITLVLFISLICGTLQTGQKLKTFCYFTNWSSKLQTVNARFEISNIHPRLCTHLIYAFANINTENLRLQRSETDDDNGSMYDPQGRYFDFNKLKDDFPHLKTLLSVGGQSAGSRGFNQITQSVANMKLFSRNCIIYMRDRGFDGIDIDWEWPGDVNKDKFTQLLKIMRMEFEEEANRKNKAPLLLTAAVGVGEDIIDNSYNITEISKSVDYLQLMSYDFHGTWSKVTSFSSPLYSRGSSIQFNQKLSLAWAVQKWVTGGAPPEKLILGLTAAATTFTLYNLTANFSGVGVKVDRPGKPGPYIQQEGHVTYYRVCEVLENGATGYWDNEQKMAFTFVGDQWYGYETPRSMREKVAFAYEQELGGVMFWSLDLDDFKGDHCHQNPYPLLGAVYDAVEAMAPTTRGPTGTTPTTTPIDFSLHHRTNKDGVNTFDMVDPRDGANVAKCYWSSMILSAILAIWLSRTFV